MKEKDFQSRFNLILESLIIDRKQRGSTSHEGQRFNLILESLIIDRL